MQDRTYLSNTKGATIINDVEGIVEAFVAGIGNKDSVSDIIEKGAFDQSLMTRTPRVCWGHDWNHPIGKVMEMREVPAGHPSLPDKMRHAGIGGLYAKVKFNLGTMSGREAFSNVEFFGEDQEWSIGYKTHDATYDQQKKANRLKRLELFEVSPVLHGANQLTGTVSVKDGSGEENTALADDFTMALSDHAGEAVEVTKATDNRIMYKTAVGDSFVVAHAERDGEHMFGSATKVLVDVPEVFADAETSDDGALASMTKDMLEGYAAQEEAAQSSTRIGCDGTHVVDGRWFPCADPESLRQSMREANAAGNSGPPTTAQMPEKTLEGKEGGPGEMTDEDLRRLVGAIEVIKDFGKAIMKMRGNTSPTPSAPTPAPAPTPAQAPPPAAAGAAPAQAAPKTLQIEVSADTDMAALLPDLADLHIKVDGHKLTLTNEADEVVTKGLLAIVLQKHNITKLDARRVQETS